MMMNNFEIQNKYQIKIHNYSNREINFCSQVIEVKFFISIYNLIQKYIEQKQSKLFRQNQMEISLQKLKQYVQNPLLKNDPSWMSLFQSDIRNIFPKYQLTKIQRAKVKLDRCRLMMDHLNDFLFLEKHKKQSQKIDTGKIIEEIDYLSKTEQQRQEQDSIDRYQLDLIEKKEDVEKLCKQLCEYGQSVACNKQPRNSQLNDIIRANKKWCAYFDKHCKMDEYSKGKFEQLDRYQLSTKIQIPNNCAVLNSSLSAQILFARQKQQYILQKLADKIDNPGKQIQVESCYASDWNTALAYLGLQHS